MNPDQDKEIITLRRAGWSGPRIAKRLGIPRSAIYRHLDRLRDEGHDLPRTLGNAMHTVKMMTKAGLRCGTMGDILDDLTAHELQAILRHQQRRESIARLFARLLRESYVPNADDKAA